MAGHTCKHCGLWAATRKGFDAHRVREDSGLVELVYLGKHDSLARLRKSWWFEYGPTGSPDGAGYYGVRPKRRTCAAYEI